MELPNKPTEPQRSDDVGDDDEAGDGRGVISPAAHESQERQDNKLDHRPLGNWASRYSASAWLQIGIEFGYLVAILLACAAGIVSIAYYTAPPAPLDVRAFTVAGISFEYPRDRNFLLWISVGLSGVIGGTCFALKWLYHSVAKALWNRDRILWRLIVPVLSGMVSVFVSLLVSSGILSLIDSEFFSSFYGAVGSSWFIGYFSDNVLASLQKLAHKWFGTVDEPTGSSGTTPPEQQIT